jgi:hypothetical protein
MVRIGLSDRQKGDSRLHAVFMIVPTHPVGPAFACNVGMMLTRIEHVKRRCSRWLTNDNQAMKIQSCGNWNIGNKKKKKEHGYHAWSTLLILHHLVNNVPAALSWLPVTKAATR